ncbi:MAG: penicillin-insensitive murein endopeptidase [Solirubrobacterales bacterium]
MRSRSRGTHADGRLSGGLRLTAAGPHYVTWDPIFRRRPNRPTRVVGHERLLRTLDRVTREFREANPGAPRLVVGDISRPRGGDFGRRFGGIGHASHQVGLDVDIYYPRRDRRLRPPARASQVDQRLARELIARFVVAGASKVFVGRRFVRGPRSIVQTVPHHEDHLHVRLPISRDGR